MAHIQAEILTPWYEEVDPDDGTRMRWPLVTGVFMFRRWEDITGQNAANLPPLPNLVSLLVEADETVIESVKLDVRFLVEWRDLLDDAFIVPTTAKFKLWADWLKAQGMTNALVIKAIGSSPQGRTNGEIANLLRAELKKLPKA